MPFKLCPADSSITRSPLVTTKVWTRRQGTWTLLLEDEMDLRALNWLGSVDHVRFPPNSLVFHMTDGLYSLDLSTKSPPPKLLAPLPTSSYNALVRLATLEQSIQDAVATRDTLSRDLSDLLQQTAADRVSVMADRVRLADRYLAQQRRSLDVARTRKEEMRESMAARRAAIAQGRALQEQAAIDVADAKNKLAESRDALAETGDKMRGQRRRICCELCLIFRIEPDGDSAPLAFSICGLPLVNTEYDATSRRVREDLLSAALGHVALLVDHLQYYLAVPLPYPVQPYASRSSIRDDISQLADPQPDFPLHVPRGGSNMYFRFEYGCFLLNKNIETLCASQGLRVVDIRHTLPNLKYLLYVCSAGSDELPERKRGGVRGLWIGRMRSIGVPMSDDGDEVDSLVSDSRRGTVDRLAFGKRPGGEVRDGASPS